ncbi:PASTA domain-containing protein [Candidatus Solirubrobacter pratensis]|uniref:PASTA domain-containing protein n=1 Tax=Candidatus Solirubrobacter pratensis TaxID=1298857 RepID=UPI00041C21C6|nr:PASTA domain-containing protein [Candidatus Solirubrobacter pratensis]
MRVALLLIASLALAACGGAGRPAAGPRVTLKLSAPEDSGTVRAERVQVHGSVSPGDASVQVNGVAAQVEGGDFAADVALAPGANVIDVTASAPGHRSEADAVRVTRDMRVELPDLAGASETDATAKLSDLGMRPRIEDGSSFLDRIIPGELEVCEMQPRAGALVAKGTTVTVLVARRC